MAAKKIIDPIVAAVLCFSLCVNVGLAMKVHKLNALLSPAPQPQIAIGSKVESLDGTDLAGDAEHLAFGSTGKPVVLYVFTPTCSWCAKNLSNIKELYRLKHSDFDIIGVSLSPIGVSEYISQSSFPLGVMESPSAASTEKFHFNETPETIVIDATGTVKQVWLGAYSKQTCKKIEQFFKIPDGTLRRL